MPIIQSQNEVGHVYKWAGIAHALTSMTRKNNVSLDLNVFDKCKHFIKSTCIKKKKRTWIFNNSYRTNIHINISEHIGHNNPLTHCYQKFISYLFQKRKLSLAKYLEHKYKMLQPFGRQVKYTHHTT